MLKHTGARLNRRKDDGKRTNIFFSQWTMWIFCFCCCTLKSTKILFWKLLRRLFKSSKLNSLIYIYIFCICWIPLFIWLKYLHQACSCSIFSVWTRDHFPPPFFLNSLVLWVDVIKFYNPDGLIVTRMNLTQEEADGTYTSFGGSVSTPLAIVQQSSLFLSWTSAG